MDVKPLVHQQTRQYTKPGTHQQTRPYTKPGTHQQTRQYTKPGTHQQTCKDTSCSKRRWCVARSPVEGSTSPFTGWISDTMFMLPCLLLSSRTTKKNMPRAVFWRTWSFSCTPSAKTGWSRSPLCRTPVPVRGKHDTGYIIIMKVIIQRKVLSGEAILGACTYTLTCTQTPARTN